MRECLGHYFRPEDIELTTLWREGIFVLDASVLLNVYGYSWKTGEKLLSLLEQLKGRLWLPHQFAKEYAKDRSGVILKQVSNYLKAEKSLDAFSREFLEPKRDHPFLSPSATKKFTEICDELKRSRRKMESLVGNDPFLARILNLFAGRVAAAPTPEQFNELCDTAQKRFATKVPPGFKDLDEKEVPDAYGDFIGWMQLIDIAKQQKKGVILVIDDFKEDWWLIEKERTVGPRPELMLEFRTHTSQSFYMYTSENFLKAATNYANFKVEHRTMEEVSARIADLLTRARQSSAKNVSANPTDQAAAAKATMAGDEPKTTDAKSTPTSPDKLGDDAKQHRTEG